MISVVRCMRRLWSKYSPLKDLPSNALCLPSRACGRAGYRAGTCRMVVMAAIELQSKLSKLHADIIDRMAVGRHGSDA